MKYVNKVILVGNLTADPEAKVTSEKPLATFVVATNREWVDKAGVKKNLAEFHNIAAWGGLSELVLHILKKSKLVYIEGYLKTRQWDDAGVKHFRTEIVADQVIALDKRPAEDAMQDVGA